MTSTNDPDSFERFRQLTRLVLQVPKEEIADKLKPLRKRGMHKKQKRFSNAQHRLPGVCPFMARGVECINV